MKKLNALFSVATLALVANLAHAAEYAIDTDHSTVGFSVRHLAVSKVPGHFNKFSGTVNYDPANPKTWSTKVKIDASSIDTSNAKRDAHLNSPDFFDTKKYPNITFESKEVTDVSGNNFKVKGTLTMHGVSKDVVLDAELGGATKDPWGNSHVGFSAKLKINRSDYGLKWNKALEAGGVIVSDEVAIDLDIDAMQKAPAGDKK